jgi:hypothetical protein
MNDGKPAYHYNWVGLEKSTVSSATKVSLGKHTITFDFATKVDAVAGVLVQSTWTE